jgi:hypothetical protein
MHATRAAVEEGILPGGGVALLRSIKALGRLKTENHDQKTGIDIVRRALNTPARQIAVNAGEDGSIVVGKINENESYVYGFDAQAGEYGDLVSKGIIDPTKVVRTALQGAASIAGLLMTLTCTCCLPTSCRKSLVDSGLGEDVGAARAASDEAAREAAEQAERNALLEAEQKATRDARYAARKAAKKKRRRGY